MSTTYLFVFNSVSGFDFIQVKIKELEGVKPHIALTRQLHQVQHFSKICCFLQNENPGEAGEYIFSGLSTQK